ncbi:glycosyltransferase family 2 protein [Frigidibacter sp. MR17.24]|uniref:glycosyltransferase family 2 protein n=1 Tax=Frigidibacter sp. MR17.24 TaxID=3127345 RepID=UPI003012A1D6
MDPVLSLIIPTHNRRALLMRLLDALAADPGRPDPIEILILADNCHDDTVAAAQARVDLPLRVIELPGLGPAGARNRGAAEARAPLLVFLDDDVIPEPGFLAAHLAAHQDTGTMADGAMVVGSYPSAPHASPDYFQLLLRAWWREHFLELARPGHRMRYTDVLTGNLSVPAAVWDRLGGLDAAFQQAHEDYELGLRALTAGVPLVHARGARGLHYEYLTKTPAAALRRARDEGRAGVAFWRKHPQMQADLRLYAMRPRGLALRHRALCAAGPVLDAGAGILARLLPGFQRRGLRGAYISVFGLLNRYWYLRGASEVLERFSAWSDLPAEPQRAPPLPLKLDLAQGLGVCEARIEVERPLQLALHHGDRQLTTTDLDPGAEPWRGHHLRPFLLRHCGAAWIEARFAGATGTEDVDAREREAATEGLARAAPHLNQSGAPWVWHEQYAQWARLLARLR